MLSLFAAMSLAGAVTSCGGKASETLPSENGSTTSSVTVSGAHQAAGVGGSQNATTTSGGGGRGGAAGMGGQGGQGGQAPILTEPTRWRSSMYPLSWTPKDTDAEGRFIHDFSYAGYRMGHIPLPDSIPGKKVDVTKAPYNADPTGNADSTAAIQSAIDDVGANGGGEVLLPKGTYRVKPATSTAKAALFIRYDNTLVRGAGRDKTFIFNDAAYMRGKSIIRFAPDKTPSWWYDEGDETLLTQDANNRTSVLEVADSSAYQVGDFIIVRSDATPAWVAEHNMTGLWDASLVRGPISLRQITAINGKTLSIDIPLRYPLLLRDNARVLRARKQLREVGLQDLSIGGRQHPGAVPFGDLDYKQEGTPGYNVHNAWIVTLLGVVDGWVRRVGSYRPAVNKDNFHSTSNGLVLYHTRNVTVEDVMIHHPQYEGGGGNGYPFLIRGSDNLLVDCAAVSGRHAYSLKSMTTSGNVLLESSTSHPRYGTDFHMHLAMSNLIDSLVLEKDYVDATYRPYGSAHGYTTTQTVLWNSRGLGYHLDKDFIIDSRQFAWGLVIGTQGKADGIKTLPLIDTKNTAPEDFREGDGHSGTLQPNSLYRDQLARRLNNGMAPSYLAAHEHLPAAEDTYTRGGKYAGITHGSEPLLHIKDASPDYLRRSYLKFDLSNVARPIVRATLRLHGKTADQSGTHGEVRLHAVTNDNWFENLTSQKNQPDLGKHLARMLVDNQNRWRGLDVTAFAQEQQYTDGTLSLALTQQMNGDGLFVQFSSRESANTPPSLELELLDGTLLKAVSATGEVTDSNTSAMNVVDGNIDTRWSNDAHGAALTIDLGAEQPVSGSAISFYQGDKRIAFFELRTSTDGNAWRTVSASQSRGDSAVRQFFRWPTHSARYLRYVGYGNSVNDYSSVTELIAIGP